MELTLNQKFNIILNNINKNNKPNLFLHVCCGPCSTAVLERLYNFFSIYIIFYNSNIDTLNEFNLRYKQLQKVNSLKKFSFNIIYNDYIHDEFLTFIKGFEYCKEGGNRCKMCFELRLKKSYDIASDYIIKHNLLNMTNYLCTTLSVSPHKNALLIENIGENICKDSNFLKYLPSDFKKENGYFNSINLSKEMVLYRQNYCGCEFSK